jgi:DNA modification methylase
MLYKGDCLQEMKKIPDGSVDMVMTDPPFCLRISLDISATICYNKKKLK